MQVLDDPARLFDSDTLQDPYPLYGQLRASAPVHRVGDSQFYVVCGWDAVTEALNRVDDFSSNLTATMVLGADGRVTAFPMGELGSSIHALATADDPVHAAHRKLLLPHLAAKRIRVIEQYAEQTARRLWLEGLRDGRIEWMSALADRLPMLVVTRLLGLPDTDADLLIRRAYAATSLLDGVVTAEQLEAAGVAALELSGYVMEHFARSTDDDGSGLIADLAARHRGGELEQIAALGIMITLFGAAGESTASLLGSAAWILGTRPDIQRRVRAHPELLDPFLEEVLRFESPFRGHYRHVRRDTSLGGTELPADSRLLLMWGAANRDPAQFDAPEQFRLDRTSGKAHLAFGKGAHFCVGAALARLEARIVVRMLLERSTWIEADDTGPWLPSIGIRRLERLGLAVQH